MKMNSIGVDFGIHYCCVATMRRGPEIIPIRGRPLLINAVAFDDGEFVFGHGAVSLASLIPSIVMFPSLSIGTTKTYSLGGKTYTPRDIAAMIFEEMSKHVEAFLGESIDSTTIACPAHWLPNQFQEIKLAAENAEYSQVRLVAAPIAAAAAYVPSRREHMLVFDLKKKSLSCAVVDTLRNVIIGLDGECWLGSDDFDERIVDRMCEELAKQGLDISNDKQVLQKMKAKAETYKINLREANSAHVEFTYTAGGEPYSIDFQLTREEYSTLIADLVDRAIDKAKQSVASSGLVAEDIDAVVLVGDSDQPPLLQERLEDEFGRTPSSIIDPRLVVALGAAICSANAKYCICSLINPLK